MRSAKDGLQLRARVSDGTWLSCQNLTALLQMIAVRVSPFTNERLLGSALFLSVQPNTN